jgi:SAM-dependent methyltransferase
MNELEFRQKHQLAILTDSGYPVQNGACILDFGCGEGRAVRSFRAGGFDAFGCDVSLRDTKEAKPLVETGLIREIQGEPYRLPYEDNTFDVVFSDQVFEHVQNYPEAIAELHRVMKPDGVSLHIFPSHWRIIEPHVFVPFGTWCHNMTWLKLWAMIGIRNAFQLDMDAKQVAETNHHYLTNHTNYLPRRRVLEQFKAVFREAEFKEDLFLKHSRRGRYVYMLNRLIPVLLWLYRHESSTVIVLKK